MERRQAPVDRKGERKNMKYIYENRVSKKKGRRRRRMPMNEVKKEKQRKEK